MNYARIYSSPDGESHYEDVEIDMEDRGDGVLMSQPIPVQYCRLRHGLEGDDDIGWHIAPRRQFVVTLDGEAEMKVSDGETRRMAAGSLFLAEDRSGKGHRTRTASDRPRLSIIVVVEE